MRAETPQRQWPHHIGKAEDATCPCDGTTPQSGNHITFYCPTHQHQRTRCLQGGSNWEEIDRPTWVRVDVNGYEDGIMLFFSILFIPFRLPHLGEQSLYRPLSLLLFLCNFPRQDIPFRYAWEPDYSWNPPLLWRRRTISLTGAHVRYEFFFFKKKCCFSIT